MGYNEAVLRGKLIALNDSKITGESIHQQLDSTAKSPRTKGSRYTQEEKMERNNQN